MLLNYLHKVAGCVNVCSCVCRKLEKRLVTYIALCLFLNKRAEAAQSFGAPKLHSLRIQA